ncbi:hypothetical protein GCM10010234_41070 [Streptomyces hawaiiensis]|uniref:hypothetical protein n=1 Tax=Streptomyces hawaiiensis TaxID=67305 RepID=UPI0031D67A6A
MLLRNSAYVEMYTTTLGPAYTTTLGPALEHGAIIGSFGDGKLSWATRADLAAAAAVVLLAGDGQAHPRAPGPGDTHGPAGEQRGDDPV